VLIIVDMCAEELSVIPVLFACIELIAHVTDVSHHIHCVMLCIFQFFDTVAWVTGTLSGL